MKDVYRLADLVRALGESLADLEQVRDILRLGQSQAVMFGAIPESLPSPIRRALKCDRERQAVAIVSDAIVKQTATVERQSREVLEEIVSLFPAFIAPPKAEKPQVTCYRRAADKSDIRDAIFVQSLDGKRGAVVYSNSLNTRVINALPHVGWAGFDPITVEQALSYLEEWPESFRVVSAFIDEFRT